MPRPVELRHAVLARPPSSPKRTFAWHKSWRFLRGLLLGADAVDVRRRYGQRGLDACSRRRDGNREEHALGPEVECPARCRAARLGNSDRVQPCLAMGDVTG